MEKLTEREEEILRILKREPMIAQEELALRLGITRSASAVHISNLIKKGYILGRGYVFNEKTGVVVVGGSLVLIRGSIHEDCRCGKKGKVNVFYGGTARNIAEGLAGLNVPTTLISALGQDETGEQILAKTKDAGVDTKHIVRIRDGNTGKILILESKDGQIITSLRDTTIFKIINKELIWQKETVIKNCSMIVCDTSIPEESLEELIKVAGENNISIIVKPSPAEAGKLLKHFDKIDILFLIKEDIKQLINMEVKDAEQSISAGKELFSKGVKAVVIILPDQGISLVTKDEATHIPYITSNNFKDDFTGDKVTSGAIYALISGQSLRQAVRIGMRVGSKSKSGLELAGGDF